MITKRLNLEVREIISLFAGRKLFPAVEEGVFVLVNCNVEQYVAENI